MSSQLKFFGFLIVAASSLSLGCSEDVGSEDVRTGGLYARYEAVAHADGTTDIEAQIRVGGDSGTWVQLNNGEKIDVSAAGESITLNHDEQGDRHYYRGELGTNQSVEINVALLRTEADVDAPDSKATLPSAFTPKFDGMKPGESVKRGRDVKIEWDNTSSGTMEWEITGDCIWSESGATNDDGAFTVSAKSIEVQNLDKGDSCDITITLERVNNGSVDKKFGKGGKFEAIQRRKMHFVSTPADDELEAPASAAGGSTP